MLLPQTQVMYWIKGNSFRCLLKTVTCLTYPSKSVASSISHMSTSLQSVSSTLLNHDCTSGPCYKIPIFKLCTGFPRYPCKYMFQHGLLVYLPGNSIQSRSNEASHVFVHWQLRCDQLDVQENASVNAIIEVSSPSNTFLWTATICSPFFTAFCQFACIKLMVICL